MSEDTKAAVERVFSGVREDLDALVRIPSVSAPGFDQQHVRRSAEATADVLERSGVSDVRFLEVEGAAPAVIGNIEPPPGAPTVVLYAHHDVQPPGDETLWDTPPFEPVEREGRLFGRGADDDKAGIAVHAAALRAFDGKPPVGVTVFVEGEEEIGSPNLARFLERYRDELAGDVIVLADSNNWRVGQPAITVSLRGLVDCVVEVRTLEHGVHSGFLGGAFPDALTALCVTLSTLLDDEGRVAVPGLVAEDADPLDLTESELREQVSALSSVRALGEGTLTSRLWRRPWISILGIDAPPVDKAANVLVPAARAKVSLRIAPGDDPGRAMDALAAHLEAAAPWGAKVAVERGAAGRPFEVEPKGPIFEAAAGAFAAAWGREPLFIGQGGTIPFVADFADTYPDATILLTGVGDPDSRAHGANESVDLEELFRGAVAEALFLQNLGASG